jgi:hypothetical protein
LGAIAFRFFDVIEAHFLLASGSSRPFWRQ